MLTLITGAPGAGKSAALVSLLSDLAKGRAVFTSGIPDLQIEHQELEDPTRWMELVPDGSIIAIDEAQRVWRPAGPGQKVPDHIAALETHRHRGLDFFIITQGPKLIHSNVRALIGRHVHLRDLGFLGRWWYEWPECNDNCAAAWKNAPIKKRYRLPKKIFGMYKSATEHIKPIRSFPWMVVVAIGALIGTVGLAYYSYHRISNRNESAKHIEVPKPGAPGQTQTGTQTAPGQTQTQTRFVDDRTDFIPRMTIKPESAPAYDAIRQVKSMPQIVAAVCGRDGCKCYTQQATRVDMTSDMCKAWLEDRPFNPYQDPQASQAVLNRPDGQLPMSGASTQDTRPAEQTRVIPWSGAHRLSESGNQVTGNQPPVKGVM